MTKIVRFGERVGIHVRGEVFNFFNQTNFKGLSRANVTAANFGRVISDRDPRTMQFGAKVFF